MQLPWSPSAAAILAAALCGAASGQSPRLTIDLDGPASRAVTVAIEGRVVVRAPDEGLFAVSLRMDGGRPVDWRYGKPTERSESNGWTLIAGEIALADGVLKVRDAYKVEGEFVRGIRRYEWRGAKPLEDCTLAVRFVVPGAGRARPFLPGISYFGNPAGAANGGRTAIQAGAPGEESYYEEHRYPMPFACVEHDGVVAALHTVPSAPIGARRPDLWWSLGVSAGAADAELGSRSGAVASNGRHGVVKALQSGFMDYPDASVTLRPGVVIEKTFALQVAAIEPGFGFAACVRAAVRDRHPYSTDGLPSYASIVRTKLAFAATRFRDGARPGYEMYPDDVAGTHYVMGWCGQAEALAYAAFPLAKRFGGTDGAAGRTLVDRGARSLALLATSPLDAGGFKLHFDAETGAWSDQDPVSQGQALESVTRAVAAAAAAGREDFGAAEAFAVRAARHHAERILDSAWDPRSTAEAFFVSPLFRAARLKSMPPEDARRCVAAARKAADLYVARHVGTATPYWGGTLDASCEDKEAAWAGLQAFLAAYDATAERRYLRAAEHACWMMLSYTMIWDAELPPGRLRDHAFKTRGWTVVSPQNQHLDVFGVFYVPEVLRMAALLREPALRGLAAVMYRSCGQLIDVRGSQGEQIQQTNFAQAGEMNDVARLRGGYSEGWTVFWITTHFLHAAARLEEAGVDLDAF